MPNNAVPQPEDRVRAQKAVDLRLAGLTYAAIAESLDYADESGPRKAVNNLLTKVEHESVAEMRKVEGLRLDRLQRAVWVNAVGGDVDAIKTALQITDRRTRLFGLNAPMALRVTEEITDEEFAEKMADLIGALEPDALGHLLRELPGGAGRRLLAADGRSEGSADDDTPDAIAAVSDAQGADDDFAQRPSDWSNIK